MSVLLALARAEREVLVVDVDRDRARQGLVGAIQIAQFLSQPGACGARRGALFHKLKLAVAYGLGLTVHGEGVFFTS